ncbi:MAG: glycosyltransferase family 4 protein, partial [Melioribacteraceae bacterium]
KTAIVHEWFIDVMGSEKCVQSFVNIWHNADIFTLVDFLKNSDRDNILKGKSTTKSFIQKLPFAKKHYRNYLPLFPLAVEQLNISDYEIIISSSHAAAKGVLTNSNQLHICYCHTPIRYAWDLYFEYLEKSGLNKGIKGMLAKWFLHKIRMWDFTTSSRVDYFIANSNHIAKRIKKIYNKEAVVIYPPVDVDDFKLKENKDDYYLIVARFVPYKRVDLIAEAFSQMPDKKLIVIGSGPDEEKVKKFASGNIEFLGQQPFENLVRYMQNAKAFLFAAEEDFGITIVEAQACGTPVIAYKKGGASETVIHGQTGILFEQQNCESVINAVNEFEKHANNFDYAKISSHAQKFSRQNFEKNISEFVDEKSKIFFNS